MLWCVYTVILIFDAQTESYCCHTYYCEGEFFSKVKIHYFSPVTCTFISEKSCYIVNAATITYRLYENKCPMQSPVTSFREIFPYTHACRSCHPIKSIKDVGSLLHPVWNFPAGEVGGKQWSLNNVEDYLRKPQPLK